MPFPEQSEKPKDPRRQVSRSDKPTGRPTGRGGPENQALSFRNRLRKDRFLFATCLAFLSFTTWAFAISWRLLGDSSLLGLTVASFAPAFYLFYLRDSSTA